LNFKVIRQVHAFGSSCNELPDPQSFRNKNKFVALACIEAEIGNVMFNYHATLNFKVIHQSNAYGSIGGMNSLTHKTLESKKIDRQDSMLTSRYTPNDDIGHEFDAMTSPK